MAVERRGRVPRASERTFVQFIRDATDGHGPYEYQRRLADEGPPDLLRVPTGTGKTLAAVLPWLYRRRHHPDGDVRAATPQRLVVVLPQRSLVEQTFDVAEGWLQRVDPDVSVHKLLGGASTDDREWKLRPDEESVLVGTQDMVLSRLLMRGYGEYRSSWPMSFGLLHADTQFVFDEVQLMGPALPTSLQLEGLRRALGTAAPCRSMWMSATVDTAAFDTVDFPGITSTVELSDGDRTGALRQRLEATRIIERLRVDEKKYPSALAAAVLEARRSAPNSRTLVILNTVDRAVAVFEALRRATDTPVTLLHSRFRPRERAKCYAEATGVLTSPGRIVVSTQVLEAGVDITSRVLVTEAAPWPSIVQRAGRCNREGEDEGAMLLWTEPPSGRNSAAPYEAADLQRTVAALSQFEGHEVTSTQLQERDVATERILHPVLRRRDLMDLFDTAPDLTGNDIDVSRWIRDGDDAAVAVAWRQVGSGGPDRDAPRLARDELCPAPIGDVRTLVQERKRGWVFDQTSRGWRKAEPRDVRPGVQLLLDADGGGYTSERGWSPGSTAPVTPVEQEDQDRTDEASGSLDTLGDDPLVPAARWVSVREHLDDVGAEVEALLPGLGALPGLTTDQRVAAVIAGRYHDLGKAHDVFVASLSAFPGEPSTGRPWAKSGSKGRLRHGRRAFRHELASALMVLHPDSGLLDGCAEPDLVAYLVAAHHGKVRVTVRAVDVDRTVSRADEEDYLLGIGRQDRVGPVSLPDGRTVPELVLDRSIFTLGRGSSGDSWQTRTAGLRDDLGPFRLAFLEALVRLADWRVSARYDTANDDVESAA